MSEPGGRAPHGAGGSSAEPWWSTPWWWSSWRAERTAVQVAAALLVAVLLWGTVQHVADLMVGGLGAYAWAPAWLAAFWAALVVLDPVAAVLVVLRRRPGLVLAAGILVADALANGYAIYVLGTPRPATVLGHGVVTALALGTLAALPYLWPRKPLEHARYPRGGGSA